MMTGNNHSRSKQLNKTLIVRTMLREGPLSRRMIAKMTNLTPATITNLTGELISDEIICEIGDLHSSRAGRRSVALDLNPASRFAMGIHIRADRIEAGIVNLKGQVMESYRFPYERTPNQTELIALLTEYIQTITSENKTYPLIGIGIGSLGVVDFEGGEILSAKNMGWGKLNLVSELSPSVSTPIFLDNNVRTMALAEKLFGRERKSRNFIFIYLGRGIGSGIVSDDVIYRRGKAGPGPIGHMTYLPDGEACWCGNRGCLELYASGKALIDAFDMKHVRQLANAARLGNLEAIEAIKSAGEKIGTCVASLNNLFYVEKAIISGTLASEDLPLIHAIRDTIARRSFMASDIDPIQVSASSLKDEVGIIGAASVAFNEYFSTI